MTRITQRLVQRFSEEEIVDDYVSHIGPKSFYQILEEVDMTPSEAVYDTDDEGYSLDWIQVTPSEINDKARYAISEHVGGLKKILHYLANEVKDPKYTDFN